MVMTDWLTGLSVGWPRKSFKSTVKHNVMISGMSSSAVYIIGSREREGCARAVIGNRLIGGQK
jgi:hypothetical protein